MGLIAPQWTNRSRQYIFDELVNGNDCFGVLAITSKNDVIGRLHCVKNYDNPLLWYYGDLFVVPEYRRCGVAKQMIRAAINNLSEIGAKTLRCYVEPKNFQSRNLQEAIGFSERPFEPFNDFMNDGEIMYEIGIKTLINFIPATVNEAYFIRILFVQNKERFNSANISLSEWKEILSNEKSYEEHFLICKGAMPIGYIRINKDKACVSMLFIAKDFQGQGIDLYAIEWAENYLKAKGF